jgi:hypothetical protein
MTQPSKSTTYALGGKAQKNYRGRNNNDYAYLAGTPFRHKEVPLDRRQRKAREFVERVYSMTKRQGDGLMIETRVKWLDTANLKANLHAYGSKPALMAHVNGTSASPMSISSCLHTAARQLGKPVWVQARELNGCVALYVSRRLDKTKHAGKKGTGR